MTSGIYRLDFRSGNTYVGKSVNIHERFKDHIRSFEKKKAATKMQAEYDRWGAPEMTIIIEAHPDHIDILERYYIGVLRPELNTQLPPDLEVKATETIAQYFSCLKYSTVNIVGLLAEQDKEIDKLKAENENLEQRLTAITRDYNDKLYETSAGELLAQLEEQYDAAMGELGRITAELIELKKPKPWYTRLFD